MGLHQGFGVEGSGYRGCRAEGLRILGCALLESPFRGLALVLSDDWGSLHWETTDGV